MGKTFHSTRRVWVWHKSCWKQGARASTSTASKVRVLVDGDSKTIDVARKHVCPIKHNGKRASRTSTEVVIRALRDVYTFLRDEAVRPTKDIPALSGRRGRNGLAAVKHCNGIAAQTDTADDCRDCLGRQVRP